MKFNRIIKNWGAFVLLAVCIIAFWQIALLQNGMKWDFVDAYLPARYFFSEAVLNNTFPFWNPYMLYGVPFYADLVSVFNPEFWLVANMFAYSNITLQFVFLAYVFLAGVNFRYFLQRFKVDEAIALSLAIAYMLSGFVVGNAQHLGFISGYALLPLVVAAYFQFVWLLNVKSLCRFSLVFLVMIFAAYPGITVMVCYFLAAVFVYYLLATLRSKQTIRPFLFYHFALVFIVLAGSSVLLLAYFQAQPFLSRYSGLTLQQVLLNPLTFRSFLSFVFPMATGADAAYFSTDPSMSNAYMGIFGLFLFLMAIITGNKNKLSMLFLVSAVVGLLAALGNQFFLREFLYTYFPFMNMFKYPSIFRAFSIFGFLAFAGLNFDWAIKIQKKRIWALAGALVAFIVFFVAQSINTIDAFALFDTSFSLTSLQTININEAIILQGVIQLLLLGTLLFFLVFKSKKSYLPFIFVLLFAIDGIIATQLNIHHTVIGKDDPVEFKAYLDAQPKGFPIPQLRPIGENSDKNAAGSFTWRNNNVFPKRPTFDGMVSFKLDGYYKLSQDFPELMEAMKKQPLLFLTDDVRLYNDTLSRGEKTVFSKAEDLQNLKEKRLQLAPSDQLRITHFSPNSITIKTQAEHDNLLVFQQNYYNGWQVWVDGKQQKLFQTNYSIMSTLLPAGEHLVQFKYRNNMVLVFFVVSMFIVLLLASLLFLLHWRQHPKQRQLMLLLACSVLFLVIALSLFNRLRYAQSKNGLLPKIAQEFKTLKSNKNNSVTTFLSYASAADYDMPAADYNFYLESNNELSAFGKILAGTKSQQFALAWVNGAVSKEILELYRSFFPVVQKEKIADNSGFILAERAENSSYQFVEKFDVQAESVWAIDKRRIMQDTNSVNCYYSFLPDEKWGAELKITIDEESAGLKKLAVLGDLRFPEKCADVNMVITVSRNEKQIDYYTQKMNDFIYDAGAWARFVVVKEYEKELLTGDMVHIYVWNKGQAGFHLDNLKVNIYNAHNQPILF